MARAHEVAIAADAKEFDRGIRDGVIKPLEKAEDALKDLGDAADDAGRDGARGVDKLEDALRDAERRAKDLGDAGDDAGDEIKRGMRKAEDSVDEFRREANSTAKESAASFDGSAESIVDAFQEIAANAFAGFGPAGAVAGLAAAAGIGLAMAGFENIQEAEEESKKRAGEWAQAYIDAGGKVLNAATTTAVALDIATGDRFEEAKTNAQNWGVEISVAIAAMAGEKWALSAANESLAETESKLQREMENTGIQYPEMVENLTETTLAASAGRTALEGITGEMQRGGEQADAYSRYLKQVAQNTEGATSATDEFGDSVTTLPDGTTIYIDAETGQATTNVDAIEQKIYGIPDGSSTVRVTADTSQVDREMRRLSGTTLRIGTRFVTSGADWD